MKFKGTWIKWALLLGVLGTLAAQSDNTRVLEVGPGGELRVSLDQGDIQIHTWDRSQVSVQARGVEQGGLLTQQSGNLIELSLDRRRSRWGDVRVEVSVPQRFDLDIRTGGGDVTVSGLLQGLMQITTAGGDIEFDDVQGEVRVNTHGGDIDGGEIAGNTEVRTHGGDISLGNVGGTLDVTTHGGDIELREVRSQLVAKTFGGDVEVTRVGGRADITTNGGDIKVGSVAAETTLRTAGGDIEIRSSDGPVTAETAGGDIEVRQVKGWIKASTAGGDIDAELVPSGGGESSLESRGGDITLMLPADARVSVHARVRIRGYWNGREDDYGIDSEFPSSQYDKGDSEITGTYEINGGGPAIQIETVNGMIRLLQSRRK